MDGGTRFRVYWVGMGVYRGVYYANLSIVQFRAMILGIHVYVYIGYMVIDVCRVNKSQYWADGRYVLNR